MPPPEFEFDLRVEAGERPDTLTEAVAAAVIRYAGYAAAAGRELGSEIGAAVREICTGGGACAIRFRARSGELEVLISSPRHATRRLVRAIPA